MGVNLLCLLHCAYLYIYEQSFLVFPWVYISVIGWRLASIVKIDICIVSARYFSDIRM